MGREEMEILLLGDTEQRTTFWDDLTAWVSSRGEVPERRWELLRTEEEIEITVLPRQSPLAPIVAPTFGLLAAMVATLFLRVGIALIAGPALGLGEWGDALLWQRVGMAAFGVLFVVVAIGALVSSFGFLTLFARNLAGRERISVDDGSIRIERPNLLRLGPWEYYGSGVSGLRVDRVPRFPCGAIAALDPPGRKPGETLSGRHCLAFDDLDDGIVRFARGLREKEANELLDELVGGYQQ